ncbi:YuzB family protein [Brevibacillus ginsengisoli]|uniref:YuzB family protein n=1 Tax=Brevibacillus ginsengisoli TaxID=363854 RepID=UPI003CEBDD6E
MKALIEFCSSNVSSYTKELITQLENDPSIDVDVVEYGCLGHCGECYMGPFALVNGTFLHASTTEELYAKIKTQLHKDEEALDKDLPY